jgi:hypothetical protein
MDREPAAVDILSQIPGVDFDTAWKHRVEGLIDSATGLTANFISSDDLLRAKLAAGRPQDLADAVAIQKATESKASRKEPGDQP